MSQLEKSIVKQVWDKSWTAHDKVKNLLFFSDIRKTVKESTNNSQKNEASSGDKKEPGSYRPSQMIGLFLGPLLFALTMLFFSPEGLEYSAKAVLATTIWIAVWWITEAIPIPVTSLLPLILLPITEAAAGADVASAYGDPIIFLFLGGFLIAIAMERWNLHKRIAILIVSAIGTSPKRIILGFMLATGFLSMWVSNTAAVMMMLPIGTAITYQAVANSRKLQGESSIKPFEKAAIFGIGFAGTIGGLGTLIGTPPNIILAGAVSSLYGMEISFASWMFFAVPVVIIMLFATWYYLVNIAFPIQIKELPGGEELIKNEKSQLGKMSFEEKAVFSVFVFAAFMWISRSFIWDGLIPGISDAMIAIIAGVLLFLIPAKNKTGKLLDWDVSRDLPWGVLLLFGGGLAIAAGFKDTGLADWIGQQLTVLDGLSFLLIIICITAFVLFLTEITSNTATATMILPILASLALALNVHPLALMVPAAMAANCAFMLPVGTPPNAIIYATERITIGEMVKAGFWLNIFATILIVAAVYVMLPLIMGIDITVFPTEWK